MILSSMLIIAFQLHRELDVVLTNESVTNSDSTQSYRCKLDLIPPSLHPSFHPFRFRVMRSEADPTVVRRCLGVCVTCVCLDVLPSTSGHGPDETTDGFLCGISSRPGLECLSAPG